MGFQIAYKTDIGNAKDVNQDGLLIKTARAKEKDVAFLCVCDGMGGLSDGEMASTCVICAMSDWFDKSLPGLMGSENFEEDVKRDLSRVVESANSRLNAYGIRHNIQLGTTCTAVLVVEDEYIGIHVGDTRLYEIMNSVQQITEDQTVLAREIALGRVSTQDAKNDSRASILLQCIGAAGQVQPAFVKNKISRGSMLMLCSDGFRNKVDEFEMFEGFRPKYMTDPRTMEKQCEYFTELAKQRGERDNITVLVAKLI
ncbi:MAG: serine/threonine-protein phosphatase [Lachnospiraceae bacterium]|nr:serine/threonine-protein phosphatase [Lachnospiraceae bacterium]